MTDQNEVLAVVRASLGRRILGLGALWFLVFTLFYLALAESPGFGWRVFLIALGLVAAWLAERMRQATDMTLELTEEELRDSSGRRVALVSEIKELDRGVFAFKPSNGFLLTLRSPCARVWRPGMWWRVGKRVGVGGMTPGSQTKFMAEIISAMIAERDDTLPR